MRLAAIGTGHASASMRVASTPRRTLMISSAFTRFVMCGLNDHAFISTTDVPDLADDGIHGR